MGWERTPRCSSSSRRRRLRTHHQTYLRRPTGGGGGPAGGGGGGGGGAGPGGINPAGPIGALLGLAGIAYGGYNSFYTVEGGHRALLFNRLVGVKEEVQVRFWFGCCSDFVGCN